MPKHPPGVRIDCSPGFASQNAVDVNRVNTRADLRRLLVGGSVGDLVCIKNHDVCKIALCQNASAFQPKAAGA